MCSKISVIQHKFCRYRYYWYGYSGTDTDINIGAPLIIIVKLENVYKIILC